MNGPTYPSAWRVELVRNANPKARAWYFVSRFTSRTAVEYVLDGFGDEPARFRTRREADESSRLANEVSAA